MIAKPPSQLSASKGRTPRKGQMRVGKRWVINERLPQSPLHFEQGTEQGKVARAGGCACIEPVWKNATSTLTFLNWSVMVMAGLIDVEGCRACVGFHEDGFECFHVRVAIPLILDVA